MAALEGRKMATASTKGLLNSLGVCPPPNTMPILCRRKALSRKVAPERRSQHGKIVRELITKGVNYADIAARLGHSPGYVTGLAKEFASDFSKNKGERTFFATKLGRRTSFAKVVPQGTAYSSFSPIAHHLQKLLQKHRKIDTFGMVLSIGGIYR